MDAFRRNKIIGNACSSIHRQHRSARKTPDRTNSVRQAIGTQGVWRSVSTPQRRWCSARDLQNRTKTGQETIELGMVGSHTAVNSMIRDQTMEPMVQTNVVAICQGGPSQSISHPLVESHLGAGVAYIKDEMNREVFHGSCTCLYLRPLFDEFQCLRRTK